MSLAKREPYRNKKILASANGQSCTWPGCCVEDGTIVAAHSNMGIHGKSTGRKADDLFVAFLCHKHHYYYDNEPENVTIKNNEYVFQGLKEWNFMRAMSETLRRLLDAGIIK